MSVAVPRRRVLAALLLVAVGLPFGAAPVMADPGASVPSGFADEVLFDGLVQPMAVAFAPNGNVFIAEKRGKILVYSSLADTTPTVFADLHTNVHNYWDRGMLGLAVDPDFPTSPYVYVLYAYNHILGSASPPPRWPSADALIPPGSVYDDRCTNPPQGTGDGCVISGRLSRLTSSGGVWNGTENVLIEDWCQQFPSHSLGSLVFGPEGALYVSSGDGASFNGSNPDYGQLGGTLPGTPTPVNPCGDPPGGIGVAGAPPSAEGGALRSQDLRTRGAGDPVSLDGTILRVDPDTGAGWPTNANHADSDANARRIIAYGLRNPFRMTIQPGTDDVWIGDVGFETWEEINRLPNPAGAPLNFGWPCWEGSAVLPFYNDLGLSMCTTLASGDVTTPVFAYDHAAAVVSGDGCGTGSSSISGLTFLSATSGYPNSYDGTMFMTDYARSCIWAFPAGPQGAPNVAGRFLFADLDRADAGETDGGSVFLTTGPNGDLVYADYDRGEIRRIHYYGANVPPVASFTATPSSGTAPLGVEFDASGSSDANLDTLTYAWDLDGDGQYDDGSGVTASRTYSSVGDVIVGLRVQDPLLATSTTTRTVSVGDSPPSVAIGSPSSSLTWSVGDTIAFNATGTDPQDGTLPASAFTWTLDMEHCPDDCHSHTIQTFTGVKSGTFDAPDHEYPSHLKLSVTVTDSGGLTDSDTVEIFPKTGNVGATTSPPGIQVTVGSETGTPPPAITGIVGSGVSVSVPASTVIGEDTWTFDQWSDDGARTHAVTVTSGTTTVTATFVKTGTVDASNTCAGAPAPTAPSGLWKAGRFGTSGDVDWYRFSLTATTRVRIALGDLAVAGRLELFQGCTTSLQVADRSGTGAEEIIRNLPAGAYAVRISGSGSTATPPYAYLMKKMLNSTHVLSSRAIIEGSTLRLVGEVYNNTSKSVGPVFVTARIYNAGGTLLSTRTERADLSYVPSTGRAPFRIVGPLPAGYHHVSWTVSAPVTKKAVGAPAPTVVTSAPDGGDHWAVTGTVRNGYSKTVDTLRVGVTLYDGRGNVLDAARASVGATTLAPGATTPFDATFIPIGLDPDRVYVRGMVFR